MWTDDSAIFPVVAMPRDICDRIVVSSCVEGLFLLVATPTGKDEDLDM